MRIPLNAVLALALAGSVFRPVLALAAPRAAGAAALAAERRLPIHISADRIELDQKTGIAFYRGHVKFVQGGLRITAATAKVNTRGNAIETISAQGSPITFFQKVPPPGQDIRGSAQRLRYVAPEQRLDLYGNVDFQQGDNSLHSARLHYNIETGVMTAVAGSPHDQVHAVIRPRVVSPAETPTGPDAPGKRP